MVTLVAALNAHVPAADYVTPGDGATYTLAQIATLSGGTTVSGGPTSFTLCGNLTIAAPDMLNIGPGEALWANADPTEVGYTLIVRGCLNAQGAPGSLARLSAHQPQTGVWRGVIIWAETSLPSVVRHCEIAFARIGIHVRGAVSPAIEDNTITNSMVASVLVGPGSSAVVRRNTIAPWEWGMGVVLDGAEAAEVSSNTLTGGLVGLVTAGSDAATLMSENSMTAVLASLVSATHDAARIESNQLEGGVLGGVVSNESTARWTGNTISGQSMSGIATVNTAAPKLRGNTIRLSVSHGGLFIDDEAMPDLGTVIEPGGNIFVDHAEWDLINFSALTQMAIGNTWSADPPDLRIYDDEEDIGDADGNGVLSGNVVVLMPSCVSMRAWMLYGE